MAFGEVMMRLQVPNQKKLEQSDTLHYSFSGTCVNVLTAISRLGHETSLVTTLPKNPIGDAAIAHIRKLGINSKNIVREGEYVGMYFLENGFDRRPSRVTYTNRKESSFNRSRKSIYEQMNFADVNIGHFCGITLAMNDTVRQQMMYIAKQIQAAEGLVVFDCNYRPLHWGETGYEDARPHYEKMLEQSDIVFMNEQDAIHILGMETDKVTRKDQVIDLIPKVAERFQLQAIAGTHRTINNSHTHTLTGYMYKDGKFTFSKPRQFQVLDRIGAGDAFVSGMIHSFLKQWPAEQQIDFAVAAGAYAHTIVGDSPIFTEEEILQTMKQGNIDVIR